MNHSYYLANVINPKKRRQTIRKACRTLREIPQKFSVIAATGLSGTIVAVACADRLDKGIAIVRKPDEKCHGNVVESGRKRGQGFRYIIIDDVIESGETVDRVMNMIESDNPGSKCVAILLHDAMRFRDYDGIPVYCI